MDDENFDACHEEQAEHLLPEAEKRRRTSKFSKSYWGLQIIFSFSLALFMLLIMNQIQQKSSSITNLDMKYETVRFGRKYDRWMGDPRPELEEAWDSVIEHVRDIPVSEATIKGFGIPVPIESMARFPTDQGGDVFGEVEFKHQLHCLRSLRESNFLYYTHYKDVEQRQMLNVEDVYVKQHIDHCINYLRQILICNADTGLVFTYWMDNHDEPKPDFNSLRVCRDFTQARDWVQENGKSLSV
ncbi:hypothetical protein VFPPC_05587 [Pochonia chlamydosporia 170]|uniref:Tat pathway signal sequence n=1 Tax=Pochonia chlamydosporia 170 TaxID=1380566 RepID=A0A179FG90_METCM|nr:hypothetical protein VFPPC_05587 [Pochonia chlamydosporia 170]OAQ64300.2 hypothetical protein VFPPC_05587 [Pochonia chlamydosporia 170]